MATWTIGYTAPGTAGDFSTIALAMASGSVNAGDTLDAHFNDALATTLYFTGATISKAVIVTSTTYGKRVILNGATISAAATISNITCTNTTTCTGAATFDRVAFIGSASVQMAVVNATASNTVTITACLCIDYLYGLINSNNASAVTNITNCTIAGSEFVGARNSGTINLYNSLCITKSGMFGSASAGSDNGYIGASTGLPATGLVNCAATDNRFLFSDYSVQTFHDYRTRTGSYLATAGGTTGAATDIDGQALSNPFPIGCSKGVSFVDPAKVLASATPAGTIPLANVLVASGGTFDEAARNVGVAADKILTGSTIKIQNVDTAGTFDEAARNSGAAVGIIKLGETIKQRNVDYVGTYNPVGTAPAAPTITGIVPGDESLTVSVEPSTGNELVPIYLRYFLAPGGDYSAESVTLSRTGTGDIVVTGLSNGSVYGVIVYHLNTPVVGYVSTPEYSMPDADITDSSTISEVADAIKTELESITFSETITWVRDWLPRKEVSSFTASAVYGTVCPRTSEPIQLTRTKVQKEYRIDVAIQSRLTSDTSIDALVRLADQVAKSLRNVALAGAPDVRWHHETREPLFSEETLEQFSVFTSIVSVFYRLGE